MVERTSGPRPLSEEVNHGLVDARGGGGSNAESGVHIRVLLGIRLRA